MMLCQALSSMLSQFCGPFSCDVINIFDTADCLQVSVGFKPSVMPQFANFYANDQNKALNYYYYYLHYDSYLLLIESNKSKA